MRARMKRRQRIRTVTIVVTIVVIGVSLAVGFYFALGTGSTPIDKFIGQPVSSSDMSSLYAVSHGSYGPSGASLLVTSGPGQNLRNATGAPYLSNGRPVVVYIGGDFCPYCAVERWSIIMSLSRFGNFSNLHYMTSASDEGDYATFTFTGSSYSSKYVSFQPIEQEDRNRNIIASVPANYSAQFRNSYPFLNIGNKYILDTLIPDTGILTGKNWTQILRDISTSNSDGSVLQQGANAITALICKTFTNPAPVVQQICDAYAVSTSGSGIAAAGATTQMVSPSTSPMPAPPSAKRDSWR